MIGDNYKLISVLGEEYTVVDEIKIGRSRACQIILQDAEVSRHHATVWVSGEVLYIKDENSSNGTFANNELIDGDIILKDGDEIKIGNMVIKVHAPFTEAKTQLQVEPVKEVEAASVPESKSEPEPVPVIAHEEEQPGKKADWLPLGIGIGGCLIILCVAVLFFTLGYYFIFAR